MPPKNQRQRKHDRITSPGATPDEIKIDFCLGPFDKASRDMDLKWGVDRLPDLVSVETAAIWGVTMANLNAAIQDQHTAADQEQARANVIACVESALRGFSYMDAEAERTGAKPADKSIFEYELAGTKIGVMADDAAWPAIKAERPELVLYTMREVANALEAYGGATVNAVKEHFPNATISKVTPTKPPCDFASGGDEINF